MKKIGAHVSIGGGVFNAPLNAKELKANAFAMFTKNQKQWKAKPLDASDIDQFHKNCEKLGWKARARGNSTRLCTHYGIEREDIESFLEGLTKLI